MQNKRFISPLNFPQNNQWKLTLDDILLPSLYHISLPDHVDLSQEFSRMVAEITEPVKFSDEEDTNNCINWLMNIYNGILDFVKIENANSTYAQNMADLATQTVASVYDSGKKKGVIKLLLQMANLLDLIRKVNGAEMKTYPVEFPNASNADEMAQALILVTDHIGGKLEQKGAKSTTHLEQIASIFGRVLFLVTLADHFRKQRQQKKAAPAMATSKKVGRNEPCPCGSGKKYKKCCGAPK